MICKLMKRKTQSWYRCLWLTRWGRNSVFILFNNAANWEDGFGCPRTGSVAHTWRNIIPACNTKVVSWMVNRGNIRSMSCKIHCSDGFNGYSPLVNNFTVKYQQQKQADLLLQYIGYIYIFFSICTNEDHYDEDNTPSWRKETKNLLASVKTVRLDYQRQGTNWSLVDLAITSRRAYAYLPWKAK